MQDIRRQMAGTKPAPQTTKRLGDAAEAKALQYLQQAGLQLVTRNFRTPGRGGGEIDLIMREPDGTLVFVEVRHRAMGRHGNAADSIGWQKRRRIVFAARHFLLRMGSEPPCRFDVIAWDGDLAESPSDAMTWLKAAFDASA
jgi:putative endonuclease